MPLTKHVVSKARIPTTLYGQAVVVKDNIHIKGMATTAGSLALINNVAEEDAPACRDCETLVPSSWENKSVRVGQFSINVFLQWLEFCRRIDHQPI